MYSGIHWRRIDYAKKCIVVLMKGYLTADAERNLALIQKGTLLMTEMLEICYNRVNIGWFRWFISPQIGVFGVKIQCNLPEMKAYAAFKQGFVRWHSVVRSAPQRVEINRWRSIFYCKQCTLEEEKGAVSHPQWRVMLLWNSHRKRITIVGKGIWWFTETPTVK